jgi:hypothetical protein
MLLRDVGGSSSGTIVVNAEDLRDASTVAMTQGQSLQEVANRLGARTIPDLPPEIASTVPVALSSMVAALRGLPPMLGSTALELRARAFWADAADKLAAGYELEGPLLEEFKAGMAAGVLQKFADPFTVELANTYLEELKEREDPGGFGGFVKDVGGGIKDFAVGAFDAVKDPALMLYHLSTFSPDQAESWENLGKGLWHGVTHPVEFGKAVIGLDALEEQGVAYWLGNLAPAAAAAFFTGGGSAAARGATATERVVSGASRAPEWLKRVREGKAFDVERSKFYDHNQLYVDKAVPDGRSDYWVLDSYDHGSGIVSRKFTQLGEVQLDTAKGYLDEFDRKYAPGTRIADVPSTDLSLRGDFLRGDQYLEIPPQRTPIPQEVIDHADELGIQIRDSNGHVYRGPETPGAEAANGHHRASPGTGAGAAGATAAGREDARSRR